MVGDIIHTTHITLLGMDSIRIMHTVVGEVIGATITDGMVHRLIIRAFMPEDIRTFTVDHLQQDDLRLTVVNVQAVTII